MAQPTHRRGRPHRGAAHVAGLGLGLILAACQTGGAGQGAAPTGGSSSIPVGSVPLLPAATVVPTPLPTVPATRFDGRVTLSDGGWLAARCTGTGSPTILLEAGGTEGNMQEWGASFPLLLAYDATVCRYSRRSGEGSSDAPDPHTWASVLGDANQLLETVRDEAGIEGPYVFVGWSFGGSVALGEAIAHRADTVGLVILDTDFPRDFMTGCLAGGGTKADCEAAFDEDREALVIERDLIKTFIPMPEIPIVLVSALRPGPDCLVEPGATGVSYGTGEQEITAPDCATLFQKIADAGLAGWGTIGPVSQTRVDADHDGLIRSEGRRIADLILKLIADA